MHKIIFILSSTVYVLGEPQYIDEQQQYIGNEYDSPSVYYVLTDPVPPVQNPHYDLISSHDYNDDSTTFHTEEYDSENNQAAFEFETTLTAPDLLSDPLGISLDGKASAQTRSMLETLLCADADAKGQKCKMTSRIIRTILNNLGCNCYTTEANGFDIKTARMSKYGPGLTNLDKACGIVHDRFKCLAIDVEHGYVKADTYRCNADVRYRYHTVPYVDEETGENQVEIICGNKRFPEYHHPRQPSQTAEWECQRIACEIERDFAWTAAGIIQTYENAEVILAEGKSFDVPGESRKVNLYKLSHQERMDLCKPVKKTVEKFRNEAMLSYGGDREHSSNLGSEDSSNAGSEQSSYVSPFVGSNNKGSLGEYVEEKNQCCGEYPQRVPYAKSQFQCCGKDLMGQAPVNRDFEELRPFFDVC